ncbi:hypothetical protein T439DRAFT_240016 [Meredithblackwellia eburnea MCA 4105]
MSSAHWQLIAPDLQQERIEEVKRRRAEGRRQQFASVNDQILQLASLKERWYDGENREPLAHPFSEGFYQMYKALTAHHLARNLLPRPTEPISRELREAQQTVTAEQSHLKGEILHWSTILFNTLVHTCGGFSSRQCLVRVDDLNSIRESLLEGARPFAASMTMPDLDRSLQRIVDQDSNLLEYLPTMRENVRKRSDMMLHLFLGKPIYPTFHMQWAQPNPLQPREVRSSDVSLELMYYTWRVGLRHILDHASARVEAPSIPPTIVDRLRGVFEHTEHAINLALRAIHGGMNEAEARELTNALGHLREAHLPLKEDLEFLLGLWTHTTSSVAQHDLPQPGRNIRHLLGHPIIQENLEMATNLITRMDTEHIHQAPNREDLEWRSDALHCLWTGDYSRFNQDWKMWMEIPQFRDSGLSSPEALILQLFRVRAGLQKGLFDIRGDLARQTLV